LGSSGEEEKVPVSLINRLSLNMDTKVEVTSDINLDIGYRLTGDFKETNGRERETTDMMWPKIGLSWTGLEKWGIIENLIESSMLNVNFTRRFSVSETYEKTSYKVSPNWTLMWENSLYTTLSMSFSQENRNVKNQEMWDRTWAASINLKYDFSGKEGFGFPLPFIGGKKIKFKSKLTSNLNISYSERESYNNPKMSTLKVAPMFTYGFSQTVTGNLSMNYSRSSGGIYGYIHQQVGVHATANIEF